MSFNNQLCEKAQSHLDDLKKLNEKLGQQYICVERYLLEHIIKLISQFIENLPNQMQPSQHEYKNNDNFQQIGPDTIATDTLTLYKKVRKDIQLTVKAFEAWGYKGRHRHATIRTWGDMHTIEDRASRFIKDIDPLFQDNLRNDYLSQSSDQASQINTGQQPINEAQQLNDGITLTAKEISETRANIIAKTKAHHDRDHDEIIDELYAMKRYYSLAGKSDIEEIQQELTTQQDKLERRLKDKNFKMYTIHHHGRKPHKQYIEEAKNMSANKVKLSMITKLLSYIKNFLYCDSLISSSPNDDLGKLLNKFDQLLKDSTIQTKINDHYNWGGSLFTDTTRTKGLLRKAVDALRKAYKCNQPTQNQQQQLSI